ncbi:MAG: hypothetical protein ABR913_07550 [Sedimentisphaerales bacterium]|jgi:hypothetical protein
MKKKIVLLVILVIGFAAGNALAHNLLNPSFELGSIGRFDPQNVTYWTTVGTNGWHHNDVNYGPNHVNCVHSGAEAVKIWSSNTYLYQDFNAIVGKAYKVDVWALSAFADNGGLHGLNGVIEVNWLDSTKTVGKGAQIIGYYYGGGGGVVDPCDTWKLISGVCTSPTGTAYGRVFLKLVATGPGTGSLNWDDVSVTWRYAASNPNPADDANALVPSEVTALSWDRPAPRQAGDIIRCDVWFGTDPCMPGTNTKILNKQDANSVAISSLAPHQNYYWRVDCYDPNSPGPEIKSEGDETWTFNTAGNCGPSYIPGDINGDCYVNLADVKEMVANWLKCNDKSNPQCQ